MWIRKGGMLERSDKPWGANGGVRISLRVHVRICMSLQCGCTLPTSSGMHWAGRGGWLKGRSQEEGLCIGDPPPPVIHQASSSVPQFPC